MKRKFRVLALLLLTTVFLTSACGDSKEVEDLAIITMTGWDRITEKGVDQWRVSALVLSPESNESGGGGTKPSTAKKEILVMGTGNTLQLAFQDFAKRFPRRLFYAETSTVVLGESAAKEKLPELVELTIRHPETRPRIFFIATKGEAYDILQAKPEITSQPSEEIKRLLLKDVQEVGASSGVNVSQLADWLLSPDRDAVLPEIEIYQTDPGEKSVPKTMLVEGFGVIREGKLVGWLNPEESLGYLLAAKKTKNAQVTVQVPYKNKFFTYRISFFKSQITPDTDTEPVSYSIKVDTSGTVLENDGLDVTTDTIPSLEEAAGESIRNIVLKTVEKAKEYDADFLGLTQHLHRYRQTSWQKISDNWRESFPDTEVQVEVNAKIVNGGKVLKKFDIPNE